MQIKIDKKKAGLLFCMIWMLIGQNVALAGQIKGAEDGYDECSDPTALNRDAIFQQIKKSQQAKD